jgi:CelD/BcsL family acetyltransferase involved in cellulose biosynthesis
MHATFSPSAVSALSALGNPLACTVLTDVAEAEALRPAWSSLLERSQRNELTQSPDWLLTWWSVFGGLQGRQLRIGAFHDGERLVGLAPLLRRRHWYRGWLPFRRLEFLASGEPSEHGIYTNHLALIAEQGYEEKVASRFVEAIAGGAFDSWDELVLPMIDADTGWPDRLVEAFRAVGYAAEAKIVTGAPYIPLPTTWKAYLDGLTSSGKRNVERAIRAFDKWSDNTMELACISTLAGLDKGKSILTSLHHQRWSADDQAGVFHSPLFVRFHDELMRTLVERGELELLVLRARGEPIAVLYTMIRAGKVYAYQTGRRTDVPSNVKPGVVVFGLAIKRAIEQGRREFDLLADEAFYKSQLTPHSRKQVQVRATRRCVVEMMRKLGAAALKKN